MFFFHPALLRLLPAVNAAAEILPVQLVDAGQLDGALVAAPLFEIRGQEPDAVLLGQCRAACVDVGGVLVGADGQRGGEPVTALGQAELCRLLHPLGDAPSAPFAPLRGILRPTDCLCVHCRIVCAGDQGHRMLHRQSGNEPFLLRKPPGILRRGINVWIVVKQGDLKII